LAFLKNKWALAAMGILCWAIAASLVSGYYYYQYNDLVTRLEGAKGHNKFRRGLWQRN